VDAVALTRFEGEVGVAGGLLEADRAVPKSSSLTPQGLTRQARLSPTRPSPEPNAASSAGGRIEGLRK